LLRHATSIENELQKLGLV